MNSKIIKPLTDRELEVLEYITEGCTNNEIAQHLTITHHTVKAHIASILRKMGVKNRLGAALLATETGLVSHHQG